MIFRSKAPLRIGLAGGGTDVTPYCDIYGGSILNATISLYATTHIEQTETNTISFFAADRDEYVTINKDDEIVFDGKLDLLKGVYKRIINDYGAINKGLNITTSVDAPAGSGLGTSSTLVVSLVGAFVEMLKLPLGEYEIANYAYSIEREDLKLAGGKQDQYAATFGGINYMEFKKDNHVIVNPLRIKQEYLQELENNLILFYTSTSRESANIIKKQQSNVLSNKNSSIEAMHLLKEQSIQMKEALLRGNLDEIGHILDFGFEQKKKMAENISNTLIEDIYNTAKMAGASGGKISGAGGGGFMIFYCPNTTRYNVVKELSKFNGNVKQYNFTKNGLTSWSTK
jgi:D-glycero-alpha-D-manno-heptose-7-phosphate kinase